MTVLRVHDLGLHGLAGAIGYLVPTLALPRKEVLGERLILLENAGGGVGAGFVIASNSMGLGGIFCEGLFPLEVFFVILHLDVS